MGVLLEPDVHDVSGCIPVPVPVPDATKWVGTRPHPVTGTPLPVPVTHVVFWSPQVGDPACQADLSKTTIGDSEFASIHWAFRFSFQHCDNMASTLAELRDSVFNSQLITSECLPLPCRCTGRVVCLRQNS
jgi:hypothetical protein